MRRAIVVGVCLGAFSVIPALAQERASADKAANWRDADRHTGPRTAVIPPDATAQVVLPPFEVLAAPPLFARIAPYPSNDSDDVTGLSRNVEDCNKGCLDNPP